MDGLVYHPEQFNGVQETWSMPEVKSWALLRNRVDSVLMIGPHTSELPKPASRDRNYHCLCPMKRPVDCLPLPEQYKAHVDQQGSIVSMTTFSNPARTTRAAFGKLLSIRE
jgi:hypothetical protein